MDFLSKKKEDREYEIGVFNPEGSKICLFVWARRRRRRKEIKGEILFRGAEKKRRSLFGFLNSPPWTTRESQDYVRSILDKPRMNLFPSGANRDTVYLHTVSFFFYSEKIGSN